MKNVRLTVWIPEQQKLFIRFLKLLCIDVDLRGVLGREAPQNTSYTNFKLHKGSKSEEKVFVFWNQTLSVHFSSVTHFKIVKNQFCEPKTFHYEP